MKTLTYDSPEDRAADLLYERIGPLKLVKDKSVNYKRYVREYPSKEQLIAICKKEEIKLPKKKEVRDLIVALVRAGYNGIPGSSTQPPAASVEENDKEWDQDVKDEEEAIKGKEEENPIQ